MLYLSILASLFVGDGYLTVGTTRECEFAIRYENQLGGANDVDTFDIAPLSILIKRGVGTLPEYLYVYDHRTGIEYEREVQDNTTETICIPYFVGV